VKKSSKEPDDSHPFGHARAEPIGALIVSVIAMLLGVEIVKESILLLFIPDLIVLNFWVYVVVISTIVLKLSMFLVYSNFSKIHRNPSIRAISQDAINDVLVTSFVLVGFILYSNGIRFVDSLLGVLIGIWIIWNGLKIGLENIDYLMGKKPDDKILSEIISVAKSVKGVRGTNDIFAHYIGTSIHVEIHIEVDKKMSLERAHMIGNKVKMKVQSIPDIDRAFVHIDPR